MSVGLVSSAGTEVETRRGGDTVWKRDYGTSYGVLASAAEWRATFTIIASNTSTCSSSSATKVWMIEETSTLAVGNSSERYRHLPYNYSTMEALLGTRRSAVHAWKR